MKQWELLNKAVSQLAKAVSSKGAGKGNGKSQGGFSSAGPNVPNPLGRWWACEVPECKAYHLKYIGKPKMNKPSADVCVECGVPKNATPALKQHEKEAEKQEMKKLVAGKQLAGTLGAPLSKRAQKREKIRLLKLQEEGKGKPPVGGFSSTVNASPAGPTTDTAQGGFSSTNTAFRKVTVGDASSSFPGLLTEAVKLDKLRLKYTVSDTVKQEALGVLDVLKNAIKEFEEVPSPMVGEQSAEDVVNGLLNKSKDVEVVEQREKLEKDIGALKSLLSQYVPEEMKKTLEGDLAGKEKELLKLKKPSPECQAASLQKIIAQHRSTLEKRRQEHEEKALERKKKQTLRIEALHKVIDRVANLRDEMTQGDADMDKLYEEKARKVMERDQEVLRLLQEKSDLDVNMEDAKVTQGGFSPTESVTTVAIVDDTLQDQLEKQRQQIEFLMAKLQEAQRPLMERPQEAHLSQGGFSPTQMQGLAPDQGGFSHTIAADPTAHTVEKESLKDNAADMGTHIHGKSLGVSKGTKMIKPRVSTDTICEAASPELLPHFYVETADENTTQQLVICAHLLQLLTLWNQGGCQPVTFGDLKAHSLAGEHSAAFMRQLLGTQLWDGWFGLVESTLNDEDYIPRQALSFMHLALQKIQFAVGVLAEQQAAAKTAYEDMQKKRRMLPGA